MTRAIFCGDLHLHHEATNQPAVARFERMLLDDPPDVLVLGGDIYELWRRDLFGAGWSTDGFTSTVRRLKERGVEVSFIAGNHDEWVYRHTSPSELYIAEPQMDVSLSLDGEDIFVTHGHKYEPAYNPITNDLLAIADDKMGSFISDLWASRPQTAAASSLEGVGASLLGPAASFPDPDAIKQQPARIESVRRGVAEESGDSWGIYGHTHTPYIDREQKLVNWGSMTGGQAGYVEVEAGDVQLREVG